MVSAMTTHIVIVDDDDDFLQFVAAMVKVHYPDIVVHVARDGAEALAIITDGTPPAVVITDIAMPQLDGNALCRAVQEQHGERVKLIAMTANRLSIVADFDAIVSKPFAFDALFAAIDDMLGDRGTSAGLNLDTR